MAPRSGFPSWEFPDYDEEELRALARKLGISFDPTKRPEPGTIGILKAAWLYRNLSEDEILKRLEQAQDRNERERRIRRALDDDAPA